MPTTSFSQQQLSQADATLMVDDFVATILNSTGLAYRTPSNPEARINRRLQRYLPYLRAMVDVFNGRVDYDFSEPLELFNDARLEIRLEGIGSSFTCPAPDDSDRYLSEPECFNLLIECIRKRGQNGRYARSLGDRAHDLNIQSQELKEYVETVMEVYPRTMVVRGSLRYKGVFKSWFRVGDVFAGRCRLLSAIASHPAFTGLNGYILGIEQSDKWGFYIRVAFFFDASKVLSKTDHIRRIGKLWSDITDGRGCWDDLAQDLAGMHGERRSPTAGVFHKEDVSAVTRMARGLAGSYKLSKDLRIMPEDGQALIIGKWPSGLSCRRLQTTPEFLS